MVALGHWNRDDYLGIPVSEHCVQQGLLQSGDVTPCLHSGLHSWSAIRRGDAGRRPPHWFRRRTVAAPAQICVVRRWRDAGGPCWKSPGDAGTQLFPRATGESRLIEESTKRAFCAAPGAVMRHTACGARIERGALATPTHYRLVADTPNFRTIFREANRPWDEPGHRPLQFLIIPHSGTLFKLQ